MLSGRACGHVPARLARTAHGMRRALADVLERHGVPYAIGGAIALGFCAPPRATVDVDVNAFVAPTTDLDRALATLRDAGCAANEDGDAVRRRGLAEGQFRGTAAGRRVDVFVPAIDYYAELATRRRHVTLCRNVIAMTRSLCSNAASTWARRRGSWR